MPVTMHNIGELVWGWEKRVPAVADAHLRIKDGSMKAWDMTKVHGELSARWVDDKVVKARETVGGWISRGR